ncbi:hypothetical protein B0H13DRAFT_1884606 [Mycena leptocephala]|nr:hypothetical protein B0H13DRAFT_1884606 [Mycena leptocephala]
MATDVVGNGGSCATSCEVSQPSSQKQKYLCAHRPQPCHATLVSKSLGLSEYSRSNLSATLDARRKALRLISEDKPIHTARSIFVKLDYLPKGTLSLSHAHGLEVPSNVNLPTLRDSIATHIAMSRCRSREALACSQISLQSESPVASGSDDPSTRSQLYRYLLSQIAPILTVRPLKRLLDLHGIRYVDTDNIRKIRKHLSLKMCRR